MFIIPLQILRRNLSLSSCNLHKRFQHIFKDIDKLKSDKMHEKFTEENQEHITKYLEDSRILHNTILYSYTGQSLWKQKMMLEKLSLLEKETNYQFSMPLCIDRVSPSSKNTSDNKKDIDSDNSTEQFPLERFVTVETRDDLNTDEKCDNDQEKKADQKDSNFSTEVTVKDDILYRLKAYNERNIEPFVSYKDHFLHFKSSHPFFKEESYEDILSDYKDKEDKEVYGSSKRDIPSSSVPCGGCGAFLHCQSEGLPGYIPSESFIGKEDRELRSIICQRCYYLNNYNIALNVQVAPEQYERALLPIRQSNALAIVLLDLMDVPCCIWPGIYKLLGKSKSVIVVGNKVDLLAPDGPDHLERIQRSLVQAIEKTELSKTNIIHVAVASAKTGFGIEDIISKIQSYTSNDIYILGCTNVGKSSFFNALLGSDLCANIATSLVQRATASNWPGTTLNLLKFPIQKSTGTLMYRRSMRLKSKNKEDFEKERVEDYTQSISVATLTDTIKKTVSRKDPFSLDKHADSSLGINDNDSRFENYRWCFDTPGTVQPDQLLCLLTHEELVKVIPKEMIIPRTYFFLPGHSLFIGGLARVDLLQSDSFVRLTVFASNDLPITIVKTNDAASVYESYLGSPLLEVPNGSEDRLKKWPNLKSKDVNILTDGYKAATSDIVLSSAGFCSVSADKNEISLRCWTPSGRGIYVRETPMLPLAVTLRGRKERRSFIYGPHKFYIPKGIK